MVRRFVMLICICQAFLVWLAPGETAFAQGKIVHQSVTSLRENEKLVVEASVDGTSRNVVYMRLYYKTPGEASYSYVKMQKIGSTYLVELSPTEFSPPQLNYFVLALLEDQSVITYPAWNPYGNPVEVSVAGGGGVGARPSASTPESTPSTPETMQELGFAMQPDTAASETPVASETDGESPMLILSPEANEQIALGDEVLIAVSFVPVDDSIDVESVNLFVDGLNVTLKADVNENLLTYTTSDLRPGRHRILVRGYYVSGAEIEPVSWAFTVVGSEDITRRDAYVRGRVYAETRQENVSTRSFSESQLGGNVYGKYGIARFDARLLLTSRESSRSQARHRYTLNVDLPVLGLTFGDTYPRFNDLMLWGKRVRGIHGRLHLGFFNVDFVHGETVRAIDPLRSVVTNPATGDTLQTVAGTDSTQVVSRGTFRQRLLGVRTSFGSGKHFQWGLNFLSVRDDTNSVPAGQAIRTPEDNLVLGTDLLFSFDRRRIQLRGGVATSFHTKDISRGVLSKEKLEETFDVDIPIDLEDFKDFIILNSTTVPLDPRNLSALAWNAELRLNYFNNVFSFGYKSIGPQYLSLANSYLRTNLKGFFIKDRLRVYNNRVFINLGYEHYEDNFTGNNNSPSTDLKTLHAGVSFYPGAGYPNLTLSVRNHNRDNGVDQLDIQNLPTGPDTTDNRENNNTRDLSAQLTYDVNWLNLNHTVSVSYIVSDRSDEFGRVQSNFASNVQMVSARTQHQIPLITTLSFARNDNEFAGGQNTFDFQMFGVKGEYFLLDRRLRTYGQFKLTSGSGANLAGATQTVTDYNRLAFNVGFRYEISPGHFFYADGHLVRFNDDGRTVDTSTGTVLGSNPSFTDRVLKVHYEKRF